MSKHPIQPLERDKQGVIRFKSNSIVKYLLANGGLDLNDLHRVEAEFTKDDWDQFHQLIGYSHSGIPGVDEEIWQAADAMFMAGISELEARCNVLRDKMDTLKAALRQPIADLYGVHPDDLKS